MSMWDRESIRELRGAVYRADESLPDLVRGRLSDEVLQMVGDGLLAVVAAGVAGATEVAAQCAVALRNRNWEGDSELADQLDAACGRGATPMLRSLSVDLDDVALALHGDQAMGGGRIDRETGVWRPYDDGYDDVGDEDEDEDDPDRWLYVESMGSHESYHDMEVFISTVADPDIVDRLEIAITGRGAFRRFKDVLSRWPDELTRYFAMRDERERGRARAWLADQGYRPVWARNTNP
jgi:uncharacterized protein UPF0158